MSAVVTELQQANDAESVRGIILTGSGEAFCGGLDVAALSAGADPVEFATHLVELLGLLPKLTKPVAAAVNGDRGGVGRFDRLRL